jgi:hypothetical protein
MADELTADELEVKDEENEDEIIADEDDEESEETGDEDKPTPGDSDDLQIKLDELEATNKGLIKSLSAQRGIRQDLQGQLDEIKDAIAESKETNLDLDDADDKTIVDTKNIPVEFDDDGNMFIEPKYLKAQGNTVEIQALQDEIDQLKLNVSEQQTQKQEDKQLNDLLSEKEGYDGAYKLVNEAWSYLKDDVFDAYLEKKGLTAPTTSDQAIDMIMESNELKTDFVKKYPTLQLESVLEAKLLATPRYIRKALDAAITTTDSSHSQLDLGKPASLSNANSGGSDTPESLLNKVADMSTEDYENLDPKTLAKIDKLLEAAG